jgi:putative protease
MQSKLELLMPAGSPRKLRLALEYGADAVYLGPPQFSLRARKNDFSTAEIEKAIQHTHALGKKVYLALNIFARNRKLKSFSEALQNYARFQPDAFIVSDPGLATICKEVAPQIPLHLSVQANCMNWQAVKFWNQSLGFERVILSRELSIAEIAEIKQRVPDVELEAFVHGSICIAYSGRCLLSSYMSRRDANQGVCDNSCREKYKLLSENETFLEDQRDPGALYPIEEDEHGTYISNEDL